MAIVGAGWAGIAAAVHARRAGHDVQVLEMAPQLGGRARSVAVEGLLLDNGQHILIGAYRATLELMGLLDADSERLLRRTPLALCGPDGLGLRLHPGAPMTAFVRGVLAHEGWRWRDRLALLRRAAGWAASGFRCGKSVSVGELCHEMPLVLREQLIEPLCLAALNTPAALASGQVFLRVLRDALFSGPGSADLLLPTAPLRDLLPQPALRWFAKHGVAYNPSTRVLGLQRDGAAWQLDGRTFDAVVLACSAREAARLSAAVQPSWAGQAAALTYEPIITVYLSCPEARLTLPMVVLPCGPEEPAQFAFDLGALGMPEGVFAFVISGAREWVDRGLDSTAQAVLQQALRAFPAGTWPAPPKLLHVAAEKRATFRCTPGLERPAGTIAPGLLAAGDYVAGPYPATLEGAVRSGRDAAQSLFQ